MKVKQMKALLVLGLIVPFLIIGKSVLAATDKEKTEFEKQSGFGYEIKFPDNQIGEKQGALSLKMEVGQEQTIPVVFTNHGDDEITIISKTTGARTNSNGMIEYGPNKFKEDDSLEYDLTDLFSMPEEIKIPAQKEVTIDIKIKMPKVAYDGIVLGGVQLKVKDNEENQTDSMVVNKFARLFGVTLRMTDKEIKPELALKKIYPILKNYTNAINLDIANTTAIKVSELTTEVEIKNKNNELITYNTRKNNMEMAPNSLMGYSVSLDGEPMVAGDYTAHVKVYNNEHNWEWTEEFNISDDEADKFNKDSMGIVQERKFDWKLIVIGSAVGLVSLITIFVSVTQVRKKKQKKTEESSNKKRKRAR